MQKTLDNVKGVQTEKRLAGEEAYRKASKKVLKADLLNHSLKLFTNKLDFGTVLD